MDYQILVSTDGPADLEEQVLRAIKDGWAPQGGVAVMPHATNSSRVQIICQAMTKN